MHKDISINSPQSDNLNTMITMTSRTQQQKFIKLKGKDLPPPFQTHVIENIQNTNLHGVVTRQNAPPSYEQSHIKMGSLR